MNAGTVETVGILKLKMYHMEFTKMFRHPKYYKELRKRNKLAESRQPVVGGQQQSDQVISGASATASVQRAPGPGLKQQASSQTKTSLSSESLKHQAASVKS